jgi:hypothetical protein
MGLLFFATIGSTSQALLPLIYFISLLLIFFTLLLLLDKKQAPMLAHLRLTPSPMLAHLPQTPSPQPTPPPPPWQQTGAAPSVQVLLGIQPLSF